MINESEFDKIFEIMNASFPDSERRTYEGQKELLSDPHYRLITEKDASDHIIAFVAVWEFPSFRFVEHIAVDPAIRGGGLGGKLMKAYIEESLSPILLEVEPPVADLAQRRVNFYKRLGFHINHFDYVQPPLQKEQPDLPLKIMSYPQTLTDAEYALYKEILYTKVYNVLTFTEAERR
ncbi:GNAT family N-acetyltransferase [Paenibacillus aceris]|uniref:Ribosomal protein S18 acetylase RimI-like enzyme n=1 Tax=Paenibacillus aceris TaxID=869555 RepID=A0ABS4I9E8_9BACL|nr:GNAT family N-acetyltransferase [Paenibacillus aceris]MBP1967561.1 ribosomal protein S18 acetylase RimI-like enzyme [Paenibacillus aceris]NHW37553.1 GNAT family N-acetyltransferase [Paenibacillus aceris]